MQDPNQLQAPAPAPEPGPNPIRRALRAANAAPDGPQASDASPDAFSSTSVVDRVAALEQADADDIVFMRGGELGRLGSLSVRARLEGGTPPATIKAARLGAEAPASAETPAETH
jgi:hypothetical protein